MKSRGAIAVLLLVLLGPVALTARAQEDGGVPPLAQEEASPRQRVLQIEARYRNRLQELKIRRSQLRGRLAEQLRQAEPDRQAIMATVDEWMELERTRQHLIIDQALEMLNVLEGEERSRFLDSLIEGLLK